MEVQRKVFRKGIQPNSVVGLWHYGFRWHSGRSPSPLPAFWRRTYQVLSSSTIRRLGLFGMVSFDLPASAVLALVRSSGGLPSALWGLCWHSIGF